MSAPNGEGGILAGLTCWQKKLEEYYNSGCRIILARCEQQNSVTMLWSDSLPLGGVEDNEPPEPQRLGRFQKAIGALACIRAVVVGLDLREYSRREPADQLFLAVRLGASIKKAKQVLQDGGILPPQEPRIVEGTGDGALVFFTSLDHYQKEGLPDATQCSCCLGQKEKEGDPACTEWNRRKREMEAARFPEVVDQAMAFVFAVNAIISNDNARNACWTSGPGSGNRREAATALPAYPVECRFALSVGDVLLRTDEAGALKCSGGALITCSRILSSDRGSHLLIHEDLLRQLESHGGLASLCQGQWGHRLHCALLPKSVVKSDVYRFADAFGFHHDGPLLRALGCSYQEPREYHIGSHHSGSLDLMEAHA